MSSLFSLKDSLFQKYVCPDFIEDVLCSDELLFLQLRHKMCALSSSVLNGCFQESVKSLLNINIPNEIESESDLTGGSIESFMIHMCRKNGLNPNETAGLLTAAQMKNTAAAVEIFEQISVVCVATAGVDVNACRAGDIASFYEKDGFYFPAGTINIFLIIGAALPKESLVRSVITATEAKTTVLEELVVASRYSKGTATGSGTDGIVVSCFSPEANVPFIRDAGHHSKLGEMISRSVRNAVFEALFLETGLCPARQKNIWSRLSRYNIYSDAIYKDACNPCSSVFVPSLLNTLENDGVFVGFISLVLHLMDEVSWGLITSGEARNCLAHYTLPFSNFCDGSNSFSNKSASNFSSVPNSCFSVITFDDMFEEHMILFLRCIHSVKV